MLINNFKMLYLYLSYTFAMQTKLIPWAVIIAISSNQIENIFFHKTQKKKENSTRKKVSYYQPSRQIVNKYYLSSIPM